MENVAVCSRIAQCACQGADLAGEAALLRRRTLWVTAVCVCAACAQAAAMGPMRMCGCCGEVVGKRVQGCCCAHVRTAWVQLEGRRLSSFVPRAVLLALLCGVAK